MIKNANSLEKAKRDPFYDAVLRHYGEEHLESAGFFDDGASLGLDMASFVDRKFLTTPLGKIINRLKRFEATEPNIDKPLAVLISTGGFCPIHKGHLSMMESAKNELEANDFYVLGGFITPDHDQYVKAKCKEQAISSEERVHLAQLATEKSDWLGVDPWAAFYLDRTINYTDIVRRMEIYLAEHVKTTEPIQVFFVCGGDNNTFSKAFIERGGLVIVPRGLDRIELDKCGEISKRVFVANKHFINEDSSRRIRSGDLSGLPEEISTEYLAKKIQNKFENVKIFLRDEEGWAVEKWAEKYGEKVYSAQKIFAEKLEQVFEESFWHGMPLVPATVTRMHLYEQKEKLAQKNKEISLPTISLDACIPGDFNISLSRRFQLGDSTRISGLFPRPGAPDLVTQISAIPPGKYCLIDDDIATGKTIQDFMRQLPKSVKIEKIISVNELSSGAKLQTIEVSSEGTLSDVGDIRDFLLGSREGGLVVTLPNGEVARVPYLLPYVQNSSRMSLPLSVEKWFSKRVWELNVNFFSQLPNILVGDCPESFQKLALYLGFSNSTPMLDICRWHLKQFKHIA